jgi:hypothetical protein
LVGNFYRDSLPSDESVIFCQALEENGGWAGFAIAAIYSGSSARYLKKQSTPIVMRGRNLERLKKNSRTFLTKKRSELLNGTAVIRSGRTQDNP